MRGKFSISAKFLDEKAHLLGRSASNRVQKPGKMPAVAREKIICEVCMLV